MKPVDVMLTLYEEGWNFGQIGQKLGLPRHQVAATLKQDKRFPAAIGKRERNRQDFARDVERFIKKTGMGHSMFAREVSANPSFVTAVRRGRFCTPTTMANVRRYMETHRNG